MILVTSKYWGNWGLATTVWICPFSSGDNLGLRQGEADRLLIADVLLQHLLSGRRHLVGVAQYRHRRAAQLISQGSHQNAHDQLSQDGRLIEFSGDEVASHGADEQESQDQKYPGIGVAVVGSGV